MKWLNIWELTKINILYSNSQLLESIKKKRAKNPKGQFSGYKSMIRQQAFSTVLMLVIYSYLFIGIDYRMMPGMFTVQLTMFMLISLVYGFTGFFSIFYDSNDTKLYLPLPLKAGEVYLAKLLSAQGSVLVYLSPILPLLGISYWQVTGSPFGLLWVLPIAILIIVFINLVGLTLIHFIGEILTKSPYKKMVSTILMVISTVLVIVVLLFVQFTSQNQLRSKHPTDMPNIFLIRGFYDVVARPLSWETALNFGLLILIIVALALYVSQRVIPSYFHQILAMETVQSNNKQGKPKTSKTLSLKQALHKHHLSTLLDGSLIVQSYLMPLLYAFILVGPMLSGGFSLSTIDSRFFGNAFLLGTLFGIFFASPNSFLGVAISLERDSYNFIKTLPFNFKQFIIDKFLVVSLVQHLIPYLVYVILLIFLFKAPLILSLFFLLGLALSIIVGSQFIYWRDNRLLNLNWQNINQLFSRGKGQYLIAFGTVGMMIIGALLTTVTVMLALATNVLVINIILFLLILALVAGLQFWLYKGFWKKL